MSKKWWKNAGIRAVKTVAQSLVAAIGVGAAVSEVDWLRALSTAAGANFPRRADPCMAWRRMPIP
ncbi:MAG: holin [Clostridiales bacterium]|nr:holin [Clostridiales bacterium]